MAGEVSAAVVMGLLLALAMWLDRRWGEPPVAFHPVVWMGHYLQACGSRIARCAPGPAFVLGALAWWLGVLLTGALAWSLQAVVFLQLRQWRRMDDLQNSGDGSVILGLLLFLVLLVTSAGFLKAMLSWRMLREETGAVEVALQHSLQAGRDRLAMLVSRDTSNLSEDEVRESAIESLAENLNDSVVAPIFWFVLFGLPGAAVYRFANTADAMWGYRGMRHGVDWEWAGKWAAWADDVLSWLPARLTAVLLALVCGGLNLSTLRTLRLEARKTPSPNSGWPMAAMALALGVRLCKPGVYILNNAGRLARTSDAVAAQKYASKAVVAVVACALLAIVFIAYCAPGFFGFFL